MWLILRVVVGEVFDGSGCIHKVWSSVSWCVTKSIKITHQQSILRKIKSNQNPSFPSVSQSKPTKRRPPPPDSDPSSSINQQKPTNKTTTRTKTTTTLKLDYYCNKTVLFVTQTNIARPTNKQSIKYLSTSTRRHPPSVHPSIQPS